MNILMILADRSFPPDIRVENEALSLRNVGHDVTILSAFKENEPEVDYWKGCRIIRTKLPQGIIRKANTARKFFDFYDRHWSSQIKTAIKQQNADILHVHDLPMLGTAIKVARKHSIPIIADFHENYPAALRYYQPDEKKSLGLLKSIYYRPSRWQDYEIHCANEVDQIIVVVEEARERLLELGIPQKKISVVENNVDVDRFESFELDSELISNYEGRFVITYVGGFGGRHRGLDTAISALPYILEEIPNSLLLLVGDGGIKPRLEAMVSDLGLHEQVHFVPWQPFRKIPSYIASSTVCIIPHHANPHTESTNPHKLTQYMLMGKPVVVSSCKPLQRIINEHACGVVFKAGDQFDLANVLVQLKDPAMRLRLGKAGRSAVLSELNWKNTAKELIRIYDQLESSP